MIVLIPAAGGGRRFLEQGFSFPKPLIDVNGEPMLKRVIENLDFRDARHVFVLQNSHREKYNIDAMLNTVSPGCEIMGIDGLTEGAADTALLARHLIDCNDELLIANSDQLVEFSHVNFDVLRKHSAADAAVFTFGATHPKWSFVKLDEDLRVNEVAEKRPISSIATCGIYWWRRGRDFVRSADEMIAKNDRTNGEFYIAPTLQHLINSGACVLPFFVHAMHGLGTPEDLEAYMRLAGR